MAAKKMRMEVFDADGNRYTITFEGRVTRKKALCLLDIVELLGGINDDKQTNNSASSSSKFDKTKFIVEKRFPIIWFSSKEIQAVYEREFGEAISLSTISTYLARMVQRGFATRRGPSHKRKYRLMTELAKRTLTLADGK